QAGQTSRKPNWRLSLRGKPPKPRRSAPTPVAQPKPASCPEPAWRFTLAPRATRLKLRPSRGGAMGNGRFNVAMSFDERRGCVGTHPGLPSPVTALSLGGLRRRIEIALPEVDVDIRLDLTVARA